MKIETMMWYEAVKNKRFVDTEIIDNEIILFTWDGDIRVNIYAAMTSYADVILIDAIPIGVVSSQLFWRTIIGDHVHRWVQFYKSGDGKGGIGEVIERSKRKYVEQNHS
jgi:hypothetical protein